MKKILMGFIGLFGTFCAMDKPFPAGLAIKSRSPIERALSSALQNNFTIVYAIISGYCPTAQEYLEMVTGFEGEFWTLNGYTLLTETPLVAGRQEQPVLQPPSLVSQSAREVIKQPKLAKRVPDIWNLKFELLMNKTPIDGKELMRWLEHSLTANQLSSNSVLYILGELKNKVLASYEFRHVFGASKALEKWLIAYLINNAGKNEEVMLLWRTMLAFLPVKKSEEILVKVAKKLLKQGALQQTAAVNLLETLVSYRCDLRDVLVKLINDNQQMQALQNKIRRAEPFNMNVNEFIAMLNDRIACEKFCRNQLLKKIGLKEKK